MSVELMITRAVLEDHFSPVLRKIAGEQDAYARRTAAMNGMGNALIGAGSAAIGFGLKSIEAAGKVDEFLRVVGKVRGAREAAFAGKFVDDFDKHSSFKYFDLIDAAQRLEIQHGDLRKSFEDVADTAATSGRSLMDVVRVYDAIKGGGRVGLGLSARGGLAQFGIQPKDLFAAEGMTYTPGMKLQDAMTPDQLLDAWHKVLVKTGKSGYDRTAATTTLRGARSMIDGAMERLEKNVGSGSLPRTVGLLNEVAGGINRISDAVKNVPGFGDNLMLGGGALVAGGAVLKGVAAWRQYKAILDTARAAGALERAGEEAKVGTAAREGAAVAASTGKFAALKAMLAGVGSAATAGTAAEGLFGSALAAGAVTLGAYAVALAGVVAVGYEVVSMFRDAGAASDAFEASTAAMRNAQAQGYDLKQGGGRATGYDALPAWKQVGYTALNTWSFGLASRLTGGAYDEEHSGITATSDAASRALAKAHGRPYHGVTATRLREQQAQRDAAAAARRAAAKEAAAAAGSAANDYQLDPALDFKLKQDERRIELLKAMGGHEKELKAARAGEIADLGTAAGLLERQAAIATDVKKKYDLLDQAAGDRQKAKLLGLEKSDARSRLDKTVATILGGGGLGEDEILKRAGIGRSFFAGLGKGKMPQSPLKVALTALAKRPIILNLHLGGKPFAQVKSEIKDETIQALLHALEGSNPRALYGGN